VIDVDAKHAWKTARENVFEEVGNPHTLVE